MSIHLSTGPLDNIVSQVKLDLLERIKDRIRDEIQPKAMGIVEEETAKALASLSVYVSKSLPSEGYGPPEVHINLRIEEQS